MDRSRRQALAQIAAAFGAILVGASALGRLPFTRKRPDARGTRVRGETPAARKSRVRPAPFSVKRHG
ncbi:MAG: hypothetical protein KGN74_04685 [Gemmatimonadota bacterium]|nr:hypothetical protein [Gemmatimonadota bacterium]